MTNAELADWILENRNQPTSYPDGSVNWRLVIRDDKIDRIVTALRGLDDLREPSMSENFSELRNKYEQLRGELHSVHAQIKRLRMALEIIIGAVKPAANGGKTGAIEVLLMATRALEQAEALEYNDIAEAKKRKA